ncbi:hypothetical protein FJSC11DRAFT_3315 [Fischerella thermalis JSC-11]|jgi:hypothetical protein|uniref:Uncharacterized protein n=5 Tax=Fischerella TaxID=1190 RepID=G6FWR6_9CYAN|nr:hypothetical protein FJSC11DRAFT_3315 [Fischerella thermalis JSC-11]BAU08174.1 hypothetical protein FIS3754_41160 [Fischerella sp. NIES-3754]BCX10537.1 MAG: hypothetical protein KatS3mg066_4396 [Fischerella sp.]
MLNFLKRIGSGNMKHYSDAWIEEWCQENGWTDLFIERCNSYWAFPPGAVMPEPIPMQVLRVIKAQKGLTCEERFWSITAVIATMIAAFVTYWLRCPIPLVAAFAFNAVTVAQLEVEDAY